ncbi:hypothetical protein [Priestia megaterium]|uniref:hypothetical protein n=1 Tax=Priestia megaterium TaxID=1404 RepID=UPI00234E97C6|nr:hypothetical protein [Priestia megaterium]MDC7783947.1 hypothetical protein [Priestia megaterium]
MKDAFELFIGLFYVFSLIGCIMKCYDFAPPAVSILNNDVQLEEANIDWRSIKYYRKETKDILSLGREQKQVSVNPGQQEFLVFNSEDFAIEDLNVTVWKKDNNIKLELKDNHSFYFPTDKGDYVIEVNLLTDSGKAQYVGNVFIQ